MKDAWQLRRGEEVIGRLVLETVDMFWYDCRFEASTGWPTLRPHMEALRAAAERRDMDAIHKVDEAISALSLELAPEDGGEPITDFLVRIKGDSARLRY
ncbi:hypothetical protein [Actinacidiphila glaucinigra]|uniref:hypothetical protein n=1 Tax=Actinacidiphila glaucinigra TaxID=235986 RepID=UPI0035DE38B6